MKYIKLIIPAVLIIISSSCKKSESSSFTNKLTFGTSINYNNFTLSGEGSTFSIVPGNVAFRLESEEDFAGNPVKFLIKKGGIDFGIEIYANNPKPTGHIFITTLNYGMAGSYSVTAYIQKATGDQVVASSSFQMN